MSYYVYADEQYLWGSTESYDSQYLISDPKLTMEINHAGSFTFNIPPIHPLYSSLVNLRTIIVRFREDTEIWRGRVLSQEDDMNKIRSITCEGELAYLNDTYTWPHAIISDRNVEDWMNAIFAHYNKITGNNPRAVYRNLQKGDVVGWDLTRKVQGMEQTKWHSDADELFNELVGVMGGFVRVRHSGTGKLDDPGYVDYYADGSRTSAQTIEFGVNMLDYVRKSDGSSAYSALIPTGGNLRNLFPVDSYENGAYNGSQGKVDRADWSRSPSAIDIGVNTRVSIDFENNGPADTDIAGVDFWKDSDTSKSENFISGFGLRDTGSSTRPRHVIDIPDGARYMTLCFHNNKRGNFSASWGKVWGSGSNWDSTQRLQVNAINNGIEWIKDDKAIDRYGFIVRGMSFDVDDDIDLLMTLAKMNLAMAVNDTQEFELNAVDMRDLGLDADNFEIGDYIQVLSIPHDVNGYYQVNKIELALDSPSNNTYSLGKVGATISNYVTSGSSSISGSSTSSSGGSSTDVTSTVLAAVAETYATKTTVANNYASLDARIKVLESAGSGGGQVDLSGYLTKTEAANTYGKKYIKLFDKADNAQGATVTFNQPISNDRFEFLIVAYRENENQHKSVWIKDPVDKHIITDYVVYNGNEGWNKATTWVISSTGITVDGERYGEANNANSTYNHTNMIAITAVYGVPRL